MTEHSPETVEAVRAAEAAQQRAVCAIPAGDLPNDLADALDLRVKVNLEQTGGNPVTRVGGSDPEVRRIEAPYSKRRGVGSDDAPKNGGHQRRTARKTTRKRAATKATTTQKETS